MKWTLPELVKRFDARFVPSSSTEEIDRLCTLEEGAPGGLSFFSNPIYTALLYQTHASAVLVPADFTPRAPLYPALLAVHDPYRCFCLLLGEAYREQTPAKYGTETPSYIGQHVSLGNHVYRGAFSYIGDHVTIGDNVKIYPHVCIGDRVVIGDDTILYSGVKIASNTHIGKRCVVHAGAVLGSAGFGFVTQADASYQRVPSIGKVVLADDVEIGANTTIDAAVIGKTTIGRGTKIDNLVQVGHNVQIGMHTGVAAQVGIAGSTKVGSHCKLGGQTGIAGHLEIGDRVTALGRAGITRSFKKGHIILSGTPAFEHKKFLACYAHFKHRMRKETRKPSI